MDNVKKFYQEHPDFKGYIRTSVQSESKPFYSEDRIREIKALPLTDVLQSLYGIEVKKGWCAIRGERTPSCKIYSNNTWCDFGDGNNGGDTIKLVQTMDECDWYTAVRKLADAYHIEPENISGAPDNSLSDYEWMKLGLYPDMATKNMDIDIERFGIEAVLSYTEKYRMSMNALRKADTKTYHRILQDRVLRPLEIERNSYYSWVLSRYELRKSIGGEDFARSYKDEELEVTAGELNKQFQLLRRAVDDKEAVKVPKVSLSPASDLSEILSGKIRFQTGETPYFELCKVSYQLKENLFFVKLPHEKAQEKIWGSPDKFSNIRCSVFYQNGIDTLCVLGRDLAKIRAIYGEEILSVTERAKDKNRARDVNAPSKNQKKNVPEPMW